MRGTNSSSRSRSALVSRPFFAVVTVGVSGLAVLASDVRPSVRAGEANALTTRTALKGSHPEIRSFQTCTDCHNLVGGLSHPVGVEPPVELPKSFPLEKGRVVCTTCHEDPRTSSAPGPYLRAELRGTDACAPCHSLLSSTRTGSHGVSGLPAHIQALTSRAESDVKSEGLDRVSRACLSCHDGTVAVDAGSHMLGGVSALDEKQDHPIGVLYQKRMGRKAEIELQPSFRLDPRIGLFEGTVGCASCHSVYLPSRGHLVMGNDQSRLCLSCHVE